MIVGRGPVTAQAVEVVGQRLDLPSEPVGQVLGLPPFVLRPGQLRLRRRPLFLCPLDPFLRFFQLAPGHLGGEPVALAGQLVHALFEGVHHAQQHPHQAGRVLRRLTQLALLLQGPCQAFVHLHLDLLGLRLRQGQGGVLRRRRSGLGGGARRVLGIL